MEAELKWALWRQDDNGSSTVIQRDLDRATADARLSELEARGHKQHYWIETERGDESSRPNLLVICSSDIEAAKAFYEIIGLTFDHHRHGKGAEHYASESDSFVFEIYPESGTPSTGARLGFSVSDVDGIVEAVRDAGAEIVAEPADSEWGRRAVVRDPDGHCVELTLPQKAEQADRA